MAYANSPVVMQQTEELILGVDTHDGAHVGVLIDALGRRRGAMEIPADAAGHERLLAWCREQGRLHLAGVESAGSYGAPLVRFLAMHGGVRVVDLDRPNRQRRRRRGKSDRADAEAAARAVLAGEATAVPKARDGMVEAIRVLQVARASPVKGRTQVANQLKALILTAPDPLRRALRPTEQQRLPSTASGTLAGPPVDR